MGIFEKFSKVEKKDSSMESGKTFLQSAESNVKEGLKLYFSFPQESNLAEKAKNIFVKTIEPAAVGMFIKAAVEKKWHTVGLSASSDTELVACAIACATVCTGVLFIELYEQYDNDKMLGEYKQEHNQE